MYEDRAALKKPKIKTRLFSAMERTPSELNFLLTENPLCEAGIHRVKSCWITQSNRTLLVFVYKMLPLLLIYETSHSSKV